MFKKAFLLFFLFSSLAGFFIFRQSSSPQSNFQTDKLRVTASFYPLYYFASHIAGDKAEVINLTPAGAEPHDYEPTTRDISLIEKSQLVILSGTGLESWGEKIKQDLKDKGVEVVDAFDGLAARDAIEGGKTIKDPHVWLDPALAISQVETITKAFVKADPSNKLFYQKNEAILKDRLDQLDQSFKLNLKSCQQKDIVTSHAAFGYIASRYGLEQVAISGMSPDEEPSPKVLATIANFAKMNKVKYIFFETLVSPKLSETLAKEIGAKTLVFNPLEGLTKNDQALGKDYFSLQYENLANLKIALECI